MPVAALAVEGSTMSAAASTTHFTRQALRQLCDVNLAVARAVELAEEDPLPAAELELPVLERDEDLSADERRADVRRRVRPVRVLRVLPLPVLVHDLLEGVLEVLGDERVRVLVDRHPGGRVGDEDERGARTVGAVQRLPHLLGDVHELGLAVGPEVDLVHAAILGALMATPLGQRELDGLRADADRFIAELDEEAYLHFAGLKDTYDLVPIYERHEELTKLDTALDIGASVNGSRNVRELWRFACEGYLGNFVREEQEKIAEAETKTVNVDGEDVPYRNLRPAIANEEDRSTRERIEQARNDATEETMNPLYLRSATVIHRETERLGASNYLELYRGFQYPLDELAAQCRALLDSTERLWEEAGDKFFRARIGLGLGEIERWDVARVWRGVTWDDAFPKDGMVPALDATLTDLGVDLHSQKNVELDL